MPADAIKDMEVLYNYVVVTSEDDTFLIMGCQNEAEAMTLAIMQYLYPEYVRIKSITLDRNGLPNMEN